MPRITLGNGKIFEVGESETILDGVMRGGALLKHSCLTGRCGACKSAVIAGHSTAVSSEIGLTEEERENGVILLCARKAVSDLSVEACDLDGLPMPSRRILPCRIHALDPVGADVMRVILRLPPNASFPYLPGQYINLAKRGGPCRSYSIANAPRSDGMLELYIRFFPDGAMSRYWFAEATVGSLLQLTGPMGMCFESSRDEAELVLLATGTGMAPIKAILEDCAQNNKARKRRPPHVFWGGRTQNDMFWAPGEPDFPVHFVPVLSRADASWNGARGYVQDAAISHGIDFKKAVVYACGSPLMIDSARDTLNAAGLPLKNFYADAFVASSSSDGRINP